VAARAQSVAVVGAGVVGLSAARSLLQAGHSVVVYDRAEVPNPHASSVDASRLIRHTYGDKLGYARMVDPAYAAWDRLWAELGETLYQPTGTLILARPGAQWAHDSAATLDRLGIAYKPLDAAAAARHFPLLNLAGIDSAYLVPTGGVLAAERIVAALTERVRALGGTVRSGAGVAAVDAGGRVALDDGTELRADAVVVAAGPWTARLWPELADQLTPSRQLVSYAAVPDELAEAWSGMPMVLDIGADSGVYAVPPVHGAPLKLGDHAFSLTGDPDCAREPGATELEELFARAARQLAAPERYRLLSGRTCFYTVAEAERFQYRRAGRVHVLAGFSGHGFKFGPLIGERVAELLNGTLAPDDFETWLAGEGAESPSS